MNHQLVFDQVTYHHSSMTILRDISFSLPQGAVLAVTGPSGCGKSTLLRLCSDLISPTSGQILLDGRDTQTLSPTELRSRMTLVHQTPVLFGTTVEDNFRWVSEIRLKTYDQDLVLSLLRRLGLERDILSREHPLLSGGERQRIALARALLFPPEVLLLDEVTSALDADSVRLTENLLTEISAGGVTLVLVTHSEAQATGMATHRLHLSEGQTIRWEVRQ